VDLETRKEQRNVKMTREELGNWFCSYHTGGIKFKFDYRVKDKVSLSTPSPLILNLGTRWRCVVKFMP
jgi:hypothetical protein